MPGWAVDTLVGLLLLLIGGVVGFIGWIIKTGIERAVAKLEKTLDDFSQKIEELLQKSGMNCLWIDGHTKLSTEHGTAIHQHTEKIHELDQKLAVHVSQCEDHKKAQGVCWKTPDYKEHRHNVRVE